MNLRQLLIDVGLIVGILLALGAVFAVDLATGSAPKKPMDIVFILDEGSGLADSAGQIKQNWLTTAKSLKEQGFDCRFAVLPCQKESSQIPRLPLTADLAKFEQELAKSDFHPTNAAQMWPLTDPLKGLEEALEFEFRKDASPVVFLTTNGMFYENDRMAKIAEKYKKRGIKAIVQAHESEQPFFRPIYQGGGQFLSLNGQDLTEPTESVVDSQASDAIGTMLTSSSAAGPAKFAQPEKLIAGVKVKGEIALVCDTSGSMRRDFPPLVRELRSKFPKDTPLILVVGCRFNPPNPRNQKPIRLNSTPRSPQVNGVNFSKDPHVYVSSNTTDAIIMAVKWFRRDTVMFNNDLQDGGSKKAIEAFRKLWAKRPFVLSGRSLNCNAPEVLQSFIRMSGGDFKVDTITRKKGAARTWSN